MEQFLLYVYKFLVMISSILLIAYSVFLFVRGKDNRSRQMLGITMLVWGIMYAYLFLESLFGKVEFPLLSSKSLIFCYVLIGMIFLFPVELLIPRWINMKRVSLLLMPIIVGTLIYYIGLNITGQQIMKFTTYQALIENIGSFNVWYRFVFFCLNFYLAHILTMLFSRKEEKYMRWLGVESSVLDNADISWMKSYRNLLIVFFTGYLLVVVWGNIISVIMQTCVVLYSFSVLYYRCLFTENVVASSVEDASGKQEELTLPKTTDKQSHVLDKDFPFEKQMPVYIATLKQWMEDEKPYLQKTFKLTDVAQIFSINRTYLSRLFNEGYHQSFSEVVRSYRIEYAKTLLWKYPEMSMAEVAEKSGFSSDKVFFRAFGIIMQMTPSQFKQQQTISRSKEK